MSGEHDVSSMKKISFVLLAMISVSVPAEQLGRMHYSMPNNSPFELVKKDNGLYIQFIGEAVILGKIAVRRYSKSKTGLYLLPNKSYIETLPFKELRSKKYFPTMIQLLRSDEMASKIIAENQLKIDRGGILIIGEGTVKLSDYNIGGDCGIPAFFAFDYKLEKIRIYSEKTYADNKTC